MTDLDSTLAAIYTTDTLKMVHETLCLAQTALGAHYWADSARHIARLQNLIDDIDRQRPLGPDGKHDDRHTFTCGCDQS